jgi:hypothetical protein
MRTSILSLYRGRQRSSGSSIDLEVPAVEAIICQNAGRVFTAEAAQTAEVGKESAAFVMIYCG